MSNHRETILVVEDELGVQELMAEILTQAGYQVLVTRHVLHALQLCKYHPEPIHLLLTDFYMPYMNGRELATHARALRPQMRVLYVSGQDQHRLVEETGMDEGIAVVQKPFDLNDLLDKVRACLR